jgi:hypothetical protein
MLPSRDLAWSCYYNKSSFFPWEICIVPAQDNVRIAPADGSLGVMIPGARHFYSVDETETHAALDAR